MALLTSPTNATPAPFGGPADLLTPPGLHPLDAAAAPDSLAHRARSWFLLAVEHPTWRDFLRDAPEDEGYYIGGEAQWSKGGSLDALMYLKGLTPPRTTVSVNHIQAVVDVMVGYERQNRNDLKAGPQGDDDDESARVLSMLLKFQQDQMDLQEHESEGFEDGLIRGASAYDINIDFADDRRVGGKIGIDVLRVGEDVIWDPYARKYDLSDGRFILKYRWVYLDEIIAAYPEHAQAITDSVALLGDQYPLGGVSSSGPPGDGYGTVGNANAEVLTAWQYFWDPKDRRVLILEPWYRELEPVWIAANAKLGIVEKFESEAKAKAFVADDQASWRIVRKVRKTIKTGLVLPFSYTVLEEGETPYDNDDEHYPIVPFVAKKKGATIYGAVRNLKDPQLVENKRISQLLDILARWANIRPLVPKGSLVDSRDIEDHSSTSVIEYDPVKGPPTWFIPQGLGEIARVLVEVANTFKLNMREITGINPDLLGLKSDDSSGIAIARRQAQGQVIATAYFDRFRWTRRIIGERLARRIQQSYTTSEVLRLIDPTTGERVRVLLNPPEAEAFGDDKDQYEQWLEQKRDATGRPLVLRDVAALKYDVVIADAPSTPSARATALLALLEVVGKMPMILPAVVDEILNLADIPEKPKILRRVRAIMEAQGIPTGQTPTAPAGAPAGMGTTEGPALPPPVPPASHPVAPTTATGLPPAVPSSRRTSVPMRRTLAATAGGAPPGGMA